MIDHHQLDSRQTNLPTGRRNKTLVDSKPPHLTSHKTSNFHKNFTSLHPPNYFLGPQMMHITHQESITCSDSINTKVAVMRCRLRRINKTAYLSTGMRNSFSEHPTSLPHPLDHWHVSLLVCLVHRVEKAGRGTHTSSNIHKCCPSPILHQVPRWIRDHPPQNNFL